MAVMLSTVQNETVESNSPDYPRKNILDEDFLKVFQPFRNLQKILGTCRVDVRDRFVIKPTILQKCYTVICIMMMIICVVSLLKTYSKRFDNGILMYYLWMGAISGVLIVFSVSILYSRFWYNEGNVQLYIKMQEIDRVMKTNLVINSVHYKQNRKTVVALVVVFVIILVFSLVLGRDGFGVFELIVAMYILQTFIVELSCCSCLITFFYMRIRLINSIIINHFKRRNLNIEVISQQSIHIEHFINIPAERQDFHSNATDVYLREIFRGFSSFENQYRFQIFLFCVTIVAWVLFTFEYGIFTLQNAYMNERFLLLDYLLLLPLALMELIILLVLCVRSESFFREVYRTKQLSTLVMSRCVDGPLRKKAKNMLKLIEEMPPRFSVYGMWRMDARLLLDIFNIVTSLIVTIIQFTFL